MRRHGYPTSKHRVHCVDEPELEQDKRAVQTVRTASFGGATDDAGADDEDVVSFGE